MDLTQVRADQLDSADQVSAGRAWRVYRVPTPGGRCSHGVVAVVEHPAGRVVQAEDEGPHQLTRGDIGFGLLRSTRGGSWWSVTVGSAVASLRLSGRGIALYEGELRHLLHPVEGDLAWELTRHDGARIAGLEPGPPPLLPRRPA